MEHSNTITIGKNAKAKQDYEFVAEVAPRKYIRTVMTAQEHGMVARVLRRALKDTDDSSVIKEED